MKRLAVVLAVASLTWLLSSCDLPGSSGSFTTKPPGSILPSDAWCADQVHRTGWEPRPQNRDEARVAPNVNGINGYAGMTHQDQTWGRVRGNFVGTTDETIQWAACKWGLAEKLIRAQAQTESNWDMDQLGDQGDCGAGPASVGIMQVKLCQHLGTAPYAQTSMSFNLDYYGAVIRGCFNGWDYVTPVAGDLWGCVGRWYSGAWHDPGAAWYIAQVGRELAAKHWLGWTG